MMVAHGVEDEFSRSGCLMARLAAETAKAAALEVELDAAREELESLRVHLRARGVGSSSVVPSQMRAGEQTEDCFSELRELISWVAERADVSHEVIFNVGGEVKVGSTDVHLGRFVRWELANSGGQRLSVPYELRVEVANMLAAAHAARGRAAALESAFDLDAMSKQWEMVCAEISTSSRTAVPAIFLVHLETRRAMVVGAWPSTKSDAEQKSKALPQFDPQKHFTRPFAAIVRSRPEQPEDKTVADDVDGDANAPAQASSIVSVRRAVTVGDRVEIKYQGQWFAGVLQCVDGDLANVQCDVDLPGLITVAPLANVRLTQLVPMPCRTPR